MFKFLKEKIGQAIRRITKKVEEEIPQKEVPEKVEEIASETKSKEEEIEEERKKTKKKSEKKTKELIEVKKERGDVERVKEEVEEGLEEKSKKGFFSRIFSKKEEKGEIREEEGPKVQEERIEIKEEKRDREKRREVGGRGEQEEKRKEEKSEKKDVEEKKGFFERIKERVTTTRISGEKFDELFGDLEVALMENNVAVGVIDKIKEDLKERVVDKPIKRGEIFDVIKNGLRESIEDLLDVEKVDLIVKIREKKEKPYVILFVGVNGSGKTTSIAKVANYLKGKGVSSIMVAGDTWRAASIQQLEEHGKRIGVKVVKHDYGSDPAAVAFDGIKSAKAKNVDCVLI